MTYDPIAGLQHYPIAGGMARFGTTPYQENLFRVVFAPSRRYLVVGEWPDGSNCAQWSVKHKEVGNQWIMERWLSAEEYAKCSKETWNRDFLILGPWPERGDYEVCHVFEACGPSDANIEKLIEWVEAGRKIPLSQTTEWHHRDSEREIKGKQMLAEDMIRNSLPAYGSRPFAGAHGRRVTPTPILRTAEECGLPTRPGMITRPRRAA